MTDDEGKSKKPLESSVIFSLRELKRISPKKDEGSEVKAAPSGRMSQKAFDPDDEQSHSLVTEALSSLRERVEAEQLRLEQARLRSEEDRLLRAEAARLEEERRQLDLAAAKAQQDRQMVEQRVVVLEDQLRPPPAAPPSFAEVEAETRPRGVVVRPGAMILFGLLVLGAIVALVAVIVTRKPIIQTVDRPVAEAGPVVPGDFGPELTWLNVGDVATAPSKADGDEEKAPLPARQASQGSSGTSAAPAGATRIDLPSRPGDGGFVY